ncbi:unnamed protein product [Parnassius apollo]|uniref:(apollo) hypothetical protein n=1 Tax=Parnassius apollo TaxID=110799 RepID=A0A8S3XWI4_PARAO|nr:unnamed protein product [Parnassius apollo]
MESRQPNIKGTNIKNNREATQLSAVLPKSFASTVKQNQNAKEFVATKQATTSATTEVQAEKISSMKPNTEEEIKKKETEKKKESEEWTVIHRKKIGTRTVKSKEEITQPL